MLLLRVSVVLPSLRGREGLQTETAFPLAMPEVRAEGLSLRAASRNDLHGHEKSSTAKRETPSYESCSTSPPSARPIIRDFRSSDNSIRMMEKLVAIPKKKSAKLQPKREKI